jgi:photosystem II stability/assembly factor-like uncharacterized protein
MLRYCLLFSLILLPLLAQDQQWTPIGPFGGSARAVRVNPRNPLVLVAASKRSAALFRSIDGAATWSPLSFPVLRGASIETLVLDPQDPDRVWLGLRDSPDRGGVWRSRDGGSSWQHVPALAAWNIYSIAVHPKNSSLIAVGTNRGLRLSRDDGATWQLITPADDPEYASIVSLAFDPQSESTIYAGTPHLPWKTTNSGATWQSIHQGMLDDSDVFSLHVDAQSPQRVLASACSGIYISTNAAASWRKVNGIPADNRRTYVITQHPSKPQWVFAGTTAGLWRSTNGGVDWQKLNSYTVNGISFDPANEERIWIAVDFAGVLRSDDGGVHFEARNHGFTSRNITGFAVNDRAELFLTTAYDGFEGGVLWAEKPGSSWMVAATQSSLGGRNFSELGTLGTVQLQMAALHNGKIWRSVDSARNWIPGPDGVMGQTSSGFRFLSLPARQRPSGPVRYLAAAESNTPYGWLLGGKLTLLRETPRVAPVVPANEKVLDAAIHPTNPLLLLAGTTAGLRRSLDGGKSWHALPNAPAARWFQSVVIHPLAGYEYLVAQDNRVWRSWDEGNTWHLLPMKGLESAIVRKLYLFPTLPRLLFALTEDRGIVLIDLYNQ